MINLTKTDNRVSLDKEDGTQGILEINLNWSQGRPGLFSSGRIDLDLACLYELRDGTRYVVQALGSDFGSLDRTPFIALDGDDRSGSNQAGETLRINLAHYRNIKRVLVFAYIYEGTPNWAAADGVVTMVTPTGERIEVRLDNPDNRARTCAIVMITGEPGGVDVHREVRYIHGTHAELDVAYGWGINWTPGSK